jgi:hypothetical protein
MSKMLILSKTRIKKHLRYKPKKTETYKYLKVRHIILNTYPMSDSEIEHESVGAFESKVPNEPKKRKYGKPKEISPNVVVLDEVHKKAKEELYTNRRKTKKLRTRANRSARKMRSEDNIIEEFLDNLDKE